MCMAQVGTEPENENDKRDRPGGRKTDSTHCPSVDGWNQYDTESQEKGEYGSHI